jgi:hypothetical protein
MDFNARDLRCRKVLLRELIWVRGIAGRIVDLTVGP